MMLSRQCLVLLCISASLIQPCTSTRFNLPRGIHNIISENNSKGTKRSTSRLVSSTSLKNGNGNDNDSDNDAADYNMKAGASISKDEHQHEEELLEASWWPLWGGSVTTKTTKEDKPTATSNNKMDKNKKKKSSKSWKKASKSEKKKKDEETEAEEPLVVESWWPLWRGRDTQTAPAEENSKKDEKEDKPKGTDNDKEKSSKKSGNKTKKEQKEAEKEKDEDKEDNDKLDHDDKDSQSTSQNSTSTATDSDDESTNATSTKESDTKQQHTNPISRSSSQMAPSHPVFLMGGPGGMGGMPGGVGGGMRPPSPQQQQQMRNAATTVAAAEIIAAVVGNVIRLSVLLWSTRYFANRQETISPMQHFVFERLNDQFVRDSLALQTALEEPPIGVSPGRWRRIMARRISSTNISNKRGPTNIFHRPKLDSTFVKTVIVIEFGNNAQGDLDLKHLANLVSFLLTQHEAQSFGSVSREVLVEQEGGGTKKSIESKPVDLEIVFKIDSPGGSVSTFGLAAAQVERLRRVEGITTTVCVDKYAASGGYMIASQADKLVAAPFATVGSVGVIMETLNFHDLLRQYGVQPLVIKAGEAKNPLTQFGAVSKSDIAQEQERLEKVHKEFQKFTIRGRPQLEARVKEVCNGSVYLGQEALSLDLIDEIMTSDEYLVGRVQAGDRVLKMHKSHQSRLPAHMRAPSLLDLLPHLRHLKGKIGAWVSHPDTAAQLMQTGSLAAFILHVVSSRMGSKP